MERGAAIALVAVALVLVFGILVYILASEGIFSISFGSPAITGQQSYYSNSGTTRTAETTVVILDNKEDNSIDYKNNYYRDMREMMRYDYYDGYYRDYRDGDFRCYKYYDRYDRKTRTHCTRDYYPHRYYKNLDR
ncbi:MAG: hypothetical protein AABY22_11905 [Nanoarchaeota archaeon]